MFLCDDFPCLFIRSLLAGITFTSPGGSFEGRLSGCFICKFCSVCTGVEIARFSAELVLSFVER